jgi:hypothetical protein
MLERLPPKSPNLTGWSTASSQSFLFAAIQIVNGEIDVSDGQCLRGINRKTMFA